MKTTLLDDYIEICLQSRERVPAFARMLEVIQETKPNAYIWREDPYEPTVRLPADEIVWPESALCLWTPQGLSKFRHSFVVDVDSQFDNPDFATWFNHRWDLMGALIFERDPTRFDVIPIATQAEHRMLLADAQLSYELTDTGWAWQYAAVGPYNAYFHNWFKHQLDEQDIEQVEENVNSLGNQLDWYLGGYWQHLQQPGGWRKVEMKPPKLKVGKAGNVRKLIKPGTLGYKEYILDVTDE